MHARTSRSTRENQTEPFELSALPRIVTSIFLEAVEQLSYESSGQLVECQVLSSEEEQSSCLRKLF